MDDDLVAPMDNEARKHEAEKALAYLNDSERLVVTKHFCEGKTYVEIAQELGESYEAVKKRGMRALAKLRAAFGLEE